MIQKIVSWFIHRKFVDQNGQYYYQGVSITKIGILAMAVLKAVETLSVTFAGQGFFHAIVIPASVYELIAAITGVAARDAMIQSDKPAA